MKLPQRWYRGVTKHIDAWQVEGLGGYRDNQYELAPSYPAVFMDPSVDMVYIVFGVENVIVRTPPAVI